MAEKPNMLGREMSETDRALLVNMTHHHGYKVLVSLMREACENATAEVIKLDPTDPEHVGNYEKTLANLQMLARATHRFCASLIKSVEAHRERMIQDNREAEEDAELMSRLAAIKSEPEEGQT